MGGSDNGVSLHTRDGIKLGTVATHDSWVWCTAVRCVDNSPSVFLTLAADQVRTTLLWDARTAPLHCTICSSALSTACTRTGTCTWLCRFTPTPLSYAYRKAMTDVVLLELQTNAELSIKCRDLVKKIALYKNTLAVQLPSQLNVYEVTTAPTGALSYTLKSKIRRAMECNVLAVCSSHVILCHDKRIQSFLFDGTKEREWSMDSPIRYLKVTGGLPGREGMCVGLKNGQILSVFVDNGFPH